MSDVARKTVILAVPGSHETQEWEFDSLRQALARGEIDLDNWAWSAPHNDWLPLGDLPEFQAVPPTPHPVPVKVTPVVVATPVAVKAHVPASRTIFVPQRNHGAASFSKSIAEHREFPVFKVFFGLIAAVVVALVAINYFLVDQPYTQNLSKTPFAGLPTYAHLGAFVQPNALLIHVMPNREVTPDNFADLLMTLAQCSPGGVLTGQPFSSVSLTSSWLGEYAISANDWHGMEDMSGLSTEEKKQYILGHLRFATGAPLVAFQRKDSATVRAERAAAAWAELVKHFSTK